MVKQLLIPIICIGILASCKNSDKKEKENQKDTSTSVTNNMDTMNHMATTNTVMPELPAIPKGAKVFFANLKNNAKVKSPFKVEFGTMGIRVDTSGPVVSGSGHHHLLIDADDFEAAGTMVPKDSTHLHFGKGQKETEITLSPGKHKLTLQFADGLHRSYGKELSATITVNVEK